MLDQNVLRVRRKLAVDRRRATRSALRMETLEPRMLMTATADDATQPLLTHGSGICQCPICTGAGLDAIPVIAAASTAGGTSSGLAAAGSPLSSIPVLNSRAGAAASIYLDFNGNTEASWGGYSNVVTKVYDRDGDATTFSDVELDSIREIWARVAEDYSPFNINVTTVDPGNFANRVAIRVAIGGNYSDWFGSSAGGVAYVGGFSNGASNVAYVFEDALGNGNPRYVAEAASHEAGHTFGLSHQATWTGSTLTEEYSDGTADLAPIMGVGYYSARTTWSNGTSSNGPNAYQDDMAIIASSTNGFGYRADDYGGLPTTATPLTGASVTSTGVIEQNGDIDTFSFTTTGGTVSFQLNVATIGANLNSEIRLRTADTVLVTSDPTNTFGASLTTTLAAGTYYVAVRGSTTAGGYGNVGQYTLTGTINGGGTTPTTAPEIGVQLSGAELSDGGVVNFGSTPQGTPVVRTFTVRNTGNAALNLTAINPASLPAGFSLVSNLGATTLAAGASTTFSVSLTGAAAGTFGGTLSLLSNDSDEGSFDVALSGTVAAAPTVRVMDNGDAGFSTVGAWSVQQYIGNANDIHRATRGTGSAVATWNFTGVPSGTYNVYASYPASRIYATNSPFSVADGGSQLGTTLVNQEVLPPTVIDGVRWRLLGTYTITSNQIIVRLNNSANETVVADAIRIERIGAASGSSIGRIGTSKGATFGGNDSFAANLANFVSASRNGAAVTSTITSRDASPFDAALQQLAASTASLQNSLHFGSASASLLAGRLASSGSNQSGDSIADDLFAEQRDWLQSGSRTS